MEQQLSTVVQDKEAMEAMEAMEIVKLQDVQQEHVVLEPVFVEQQLNIVVQDKEAMEPMEAMEIVKLQDVQLGHVVVLSDCKWKIERLYLENFLSFNIIVVVQQLYIVEMEVSVLEEEEEELVKVIAI